VLDVGCGRGFVANILSKKYQVTASDIIIGKHLRTRYPKVKFHKAAIEELLFPNASFDTVICTHTLEHVKDIKLAITELRRVAKKRLIIVVPKQRPYKYTFDLHLHFFPYASSFLHAIKSKKGNQCEVIDHDLFYIEDKLTA
jgi:ubiquinone/menaquinone biosynthesis C-methylase UbiE